VEDYFKPKGSTKASKPESGGANVRNVPVLGIVKNNIDPVRAGRLQVYIADFGSDNPDDEAGWVTVSYMTPFFGAVQPKAPGTGFGSYTTNSSSYGVWNSPPDIGSTVICIFINGDPTYGFYIGCVPQPETLQMVPAIGASKDVVLNNPGEAAGYSGAPRLPVTNINTNNEAIAEGPSFLTEPKPVHSYTAMIMNQQGIIRDPLRGPISSSAQRESPSRVGWGVSTPGRPIYEGGFSDEAATKTETTSRLDPSLKVIARRGGHSIVMDDGDVIGQDQLVRIRSAGGHQILMSDDGQTLFVIHSNGQTFIELGKEGTIDMFATNSVNIRTQGELNFHADNDININTKTKLNIQADSLHINTDKETTHKIGTDYKVHVGKNETHKVDQTFSLRSAAASGIEAGGELNINGQVINLNTTAIPLDPPAVIPKALLSLTDTLFDPVKGFMPAPGVLKSITSRAPAHSPWANANQGVNLKTTLNASAVLPSTPSPTVAATNTTAAASPPAAPVKPSVISAAPSTQAISPALPPNVTGAMVAASATNAATGPLASATSIGARIVPTTSGLVAAVGKFAQTPEQLEAAGICKPGSSVLIKSLIQGGANLETAFSPSMFTGLGGATSLSAYINNTPTQISAQVTNFQTAQTELTNASVITGKENPSAIAGLVMSAATAGLKQTLDVVKIIGQSTSAIPIPSTSSSVVTDAISSGNYAAKVAETATAPGSPSEMFASIQNSFSKLTAGIPTILSGAPIVKTPDFSNIPSVEVDAKTIQNTTTAVTNGISESVASISSSFSKMLSGASTGLATAPIPGITPDLTAKINSAIASISSMGPSSIKLPVPGDSSMDRTEISAQITTLLGDAKIPKPNFGDGPSSSSKQSEESVQELRKTLVKATEDAVRESQAKIDAAKQKIYELTNTLPQGSPEIVAAEKEWAALVEQQLTTIRALKERALAA
jgi:hypothetical protein